MPGVDEIRRHLDAALGDDPREALIAVRKLINDDVPWLERRAVDIARRELWSWVRISRLLMRARQSVRERFQPFEGVPLPDYEVDDPIAALNAAAEITLQGWRNAYVERVEREQALNEESTSTSERNVESA